MSETKHVEILSVVDIAAGNPTAAAACAVHYAELFGEPIELHKLNIGSIPADLFHKKMTANPDHAAEYAQNSEHKRMSFAARMLGKMLFAEFSIRRSLNLSDRARWNVVQEHPLLGANSFMLRMLGIDSARIIVPDVYPKESAIEAYNHAVRLGLRSSIAVWNVDALHKLENNGIASELVSPFIAGAFVDYNKPGKRVVATTSGSGIPRLWGDVIRSNLTGLDSYAFIDGALSTTDEAMFRLVPGKESIRSEQYSNLGYNTRFILGYPSELMSVTAEMARYGAQVQMITYPPRGQHELRNLAFGVKHGLVAGELRMPGTETTSVKGLNHISPSEIREMCDKGFSYVDDFDYLGSNNIWMG